MPNNEAILNKCKVIVHDRPFTPDQLVRGIMGISLESLIRKITLNVNGEYDDLYEDEQSANA